MLLTRKITNRVIEIMASTDIPLGDLQRLLIRSHIMNALWSYMKVHVIDTKVEQAFFSRNIIWSLNTSYNITRSNNSVNTANRQSLELKIQVGLKNPVNLRNRPKRYFKLYNVHDIELSQMQQTGPEEQVILAYLDELHHNYILSTDQDSLDTMPIFHTQTVVVR